MDDPPATLAGRLGYALSLVPELSHAALSRAAGLAISHVGMIAHGKVTEPSWVVVHKIARALGVSSDWLGGAEGTHPTRAQIVVALRTRGWVPPSERHQQVQSPGAGEAA